MLWSCTHQIIYSLPTRRSSDLDLLRDVRRKGIDHLRRFSPFLAEAEALLVGVQGDDVTAGDARKFHGCQPDRSGDRKSTRLNSSHLVSSYAVFCLNKRCKDCWI